MSEEAGGHISGDGGSDGAVGHGGGGGVVRAVAPPYDALAAHPVTERDPVVPPRAVTEERGSDDLGDALVSEQGDESGRCVWPDRACAYAEASGTASYDAVADHLPQEISVTRGGVRFPGSGSTGPGGDHYSAAVQPIDLIDAMDLGFYEGTVVKYVARWNRKGGVEDLEKARWYLDRLLERARRGDA